MKYRNPDLRDGINVSQFHPLLDFLRLLGGLAVVVAIVFAALALLADKLAKHIPFSTELDVAVRFAGVLPAPGPATGHLQQLAERIAAAQGLPDGMRIQVHYVDEPTVNAFATLGGNIVVFRGLLNKMPSENALAMVISHEIAHVKMRHPISTLGRGLAIGVALAMISAGAGGDIAGNTLGSAGLLTALTFSRSQERDADSDALRTVAKMYGHVAGADQIFRLLQNESEARLGDAPAFLRTHPLDRERIDAIGATAAANGWPTSGEVVLLPEELRRLDQPAQ